ncbi:type IV pilus assembly protein FimV [Janthinobacterium sp. RT4P48]|uniref:type IV pilus assembly protein FimV n=1 Tax=Janthinobacterium sp. RT4P48 TaxID=3424188 RepID=UPI003F20D84C
MPSSILPRWSLIACAAACLALPPAMAAELGDMTVLSHVGQPLLAEIELTALLPEDARGVAVRLASPDVYRGGGISMDPALQGLAITPLERGGRRYVRVTTQQAIRAGHVHLYLLLDNGSGAIVRLGTLWLTPAPPAAMPAKPLVAAAVPAPVSTLPEAPLPLPVPAPRAALATPATPAAPPPDAAALAARARAEGMLRPVTVFVAPPAAPAAAAAPATRPAAAVRPPPLRRPVAAVAACAPQADAGQAEACVALDQKNAALNDKLTELEGKLGSLQKALAQPGAAVPPAAAPAEAVVPHAKPKPLAAPAVKQQSGGNGLLWLGIATLVFLLLTAVIVYVLRKRKQASGPGAPSKYWVLLRKPFGRKKAVPVLTEAVDGEAAPEAEAEPFSR